VRRNARGDGRARRRDGGSHCVRGRIPRIEGEPAERPAQPSRLGDRCGELFASLAASASMPDGDASAARTYRPRPTNGTPLQRLVGATLPLLAREAARSLPNGLPRGFGQDPSA
jgi:hypothetical protein